MGCDLRLPHGALRGFRVENSIAIQCSEHNLRLRVAGWVLSVEGRRCRVEDAWIRIQVPGFRV